MRSHASLAVGGALALLLQDNIACGYGCGELACLDGYSVAFAKPTPWEPGLYHFDIALDDEHFVCDFPLPTPPCGEDWTFCRDPSGVIGIGVVGCPDGPEQSPQEFAGISVSSTEMERVALTIKRDDTVLVDVELTPDFTPTQPNGEGCDPTCLIANDDVMIP